MGALKGERWAYPHVFYACNNQAISHTRRMDGRGTRQAEDVAKRVPHARWSEKWNDRCKVTKWHDWLQQRMEVLFWTEN